MHVTEVPVSQLALVHMVSPNDKAGDVNVLP